MSEARDTILVVDDQVVNRKMICRQLSDKYTVMEAANGREALQMIKDSDDIGVIVLDLVMPIMDGFEFLEKFNQTVKKSIPVIVMTASDDESTEERVLEVGAIDFVKKPVNRRILLARIENALIRNQMVMMQRMEYLGTHDMLTGLYNRSKMFEATRRMIDENPDTTFAFVRFDIDKFKMYNTAMGEEEGDNLLHFIGVAVKKMAKDFKVCTYGHIDADVFIMCVPYEEEILKRHVVLAQKELAKYRSDYALDTSFGICIVDNPDLSVETFYTRAAMASKKCKDLYEVHYAYYDDSMTEMIVEEQDITNDMMPALVDEQYKVYLQPKYDLDTDLPCGAEALVRWMHPAKGLISPGKFIPVFEKNGFIATLDYYMWEHVCMLLREWIQKGMDVMPISVNVSRVSMFNRHVDELIIGLVERYKIPPKLLQLEVTESAYMANPKMMGETINTLRDYGFIILMDDFGSGYSSLNTLKDINIDILKLDMNFMPDGASDGKSERIISSVVRMAGWLGMEVIAEGVETLEQKQFLESVGCGFVQGYYYAKPMPVPEFETLVKDNVSVMELTNSEAKGKEQTEAVWSSNPQIGDVLANIDAPVVIYEYSEVNIEIIRTNQAYNDTYGNGVMANIRTHLGIIERQLIKDVFEHIVKHGEADSCEFPYLAEDGSNHWIRMKARKVASIPKSTIICALYEDVTKEKLYEKRLKKLVGSFDDLAEKKKMLVIDDVELSRSILRSMFENKYEIIEAVNGHEGIELLRQHKKEIAAILLDIIMPQMDGEEFLGEKNAMEGADNIPVVVISAESDSEVQLGMLKNGVSDYIVKPFDFELTSQRVENAMSYQSRFKQLVAEYHTAIDKDS